MATYLSDDEVFGSTYLSEDEVFGKRADGRRDATSDPRSTLFKPAGPDLSVTPTGSVPGRADPTFTVDSPERINSVLATAAPAPTKEPLRPEFVEEVRSTLGSLPLEKRLDALKAYAAGGGAWGAAARVILSGEEYKNARPTWLDKDQARELSKAPLLEPSVSGSGSREVAFPEATPTLLDTIDGRGSADVAKENLIARGLSEAHDKARDNPRIAPDAPERTAIQKSLDWTLAPKIDPTRGQQILEKVGDAVRGSIMGVESFGSAAWDALNGAAREAGLDIGTVREASRYGREHMQGWVNPNNRDSVVQSIFQSTVQSLVSAGLTMGFGNASIALSSAISAANAGAEALDKHGDVGLARERAVVNFFAEGTGEKVSLGALQKVAQGIAGKGSLKALALATGELVAKDLPGEMYTTAVESAYDKFAKGGLNPNMTWDEFLEQEKQTVLATIGQAGLMGGIGAAARGVRRVTDTPATVLSRELDFGSDNPAAVDAYIMGQRAGNERAAVEQFKAAAMDNLKSATSVDEAVAAATAVVTTPAATPTERTLRDAIAGRMQVGPTEEQLNASLSAVVPGLDTGAPGPRVPDAAGGVEVGAGIPQPNPVVATGLDAAGAPGPAGELGAPAGAAVTGPTIWTGSRGAGYDTLEAAVQGLRVREEKSPEYQWTPVQRADGKWHLEGTPVNGAQTQETVAREAGPGQVRDLGTAADGIRATAAARLEATDRRAAERLAGIDQELKVTTDPIRLSELQSERAGILDYQTQRPEIGAPNPQLAGTIDELSSVLAEQFGTPGTPVVAYSDTRPNAPHGFEQAGQSYVNVGAPALEVNVARTTLHEWKHSIEAIARYETSKGLTNTPAQQFVQEVDSIFDDMSDTGRRQYVTKFLNKEELNAIADPAAREARTQELMKSDTLRSEMVADFLGNRGTDRAFMEDLAKADPKGFKAFAQKWLAVIDNMLAKLRGLKSQGSKESARVDLYVKDLNKSKLVVRNALIKYANAEAPKLSKSQIDAVHYGKVGNLTQLSGMSSGTGIKGEERARLEQPGVDPRIKKRAYFYIGREGNAIPNPEAGLGQHVYRAALDNIADTSKPEDMARIRAVKKGTDSNAFESAVLDAGFDGYANREQGTIVVLNKDVPVKYDGTIEGKQQFTRSPVVQKQEPVGRREGEYLVKKLTNEEMMAFSRQRAALTEKAPSVKVQYGELRVKADEAGALEGVVKFSRDQVTGNEPVTSGAVVSTRSVTPKAGRVNSGATGRDNVDLASFRSSKYFAKAVERMTTYGLMPVPNGTTEQKLEAVLNHLTDNLVWLYEQTKPEVRPISKVWYEGANRFANFLADRYGYSKEQGAAAVATLSPQADWNTNATLAERVVAIYTEQQNTAWTPKMDKLLASWLRPDGVRKKALISKPAADAIRGKTLSELSDDGVAQAMWVRLFDQAHYPNEFRVVHPDGSFNGVVRTMKGAATKVRWQGFKDVTNAVSVLKDGSLQNISDRLGKAHKVRNFYNNIVDPNSKLGFVTIDTHAVGAAWLAPMSSNSVEVKDAFGGAGVSDITGSSGTDPVYEEAYRRAADRVGVLPRELQSITWEAVRGLFGRDNKRYITSEARAVWQQYADGKISLEEARDEAIRIGGGVTDPEWRGPVSEAPAADEAGRDAGQLPDGDVRTPAGDRARAIAGERDRLAGSNAGRVGSALLSSTGGPKFSKAQLSDFTPEKLPQLLDKTDWAVLTAEDPGAKKATKTANLIAMRNLRKDLAGYDYLPVIGKYGDVQNSYIVTGIPEAKALELGKKYGQESILTRKGLQYMDGRPDTVGTGVNVFDTAPDDFYTEVPKTGAFFSVDLAFSKLQDRVDNDYDTLLSEYNALTGTQGGKLLDADIARELSPEYRADRTKSAMVHSAVSAFVDKTYSQRVAAAEPGGLVVFMAGGGGAGKSSAEQLVRPALAEAHTVVDGTLSSPDKARRWVSEALDNGQAVRIIYVYREPREAFTNGVLTRAMRNGRVVPIPALVKGHAGSSRVVRQLAQEFGDNPSFNVLAVDNSGSVATLTALHELPEVVQYGLEETFHAAAKEEHAAGRISDEIYAATTAAEVRPNGEGTVQERRGPVEAENPVRLSKSQGFYSALDRGIEGLTANVAPARGWIDAIKGLVNKGLAKADEVEWSGVNDWLNLQQGGKVTKAQVREYLKGNGVRVEETVLGDADKWIVRVAGDKKSYPFDTEREARDWISDDLAATPEEDRDEERYIVYEPGEWKGTATYGEYTLPGGQNYREVLLTLPSKADRVVRPKVLVSIDNGGFDVVRNGKNLGNFGTWKEAQDHALKIEEDERIVANNGIARYQSPHWKDTPNVLAHIRVNDRTDADGKRVLFVEEIQSDWGQEGKKKKGFIKPVDSTGWTALDAGGGWFKVYRDDGEPMGEHRAQSAREAIQIVAQSDGSVPAAPFVTKTDAWLNLALKRVVTMAVESGSPAWRDATKPQSIREQTEKHLGRELASVTPLKIVNASVLRSLKNDQVRRMVVELIPVDVVNILSNNGFSAEDLVSQPNVVAQGLPTVSRPAVAAGLADATALVGARLRAILYRVLSSEVTRGNSKLDAAVLAGNLDPDVVVGLLSSVGFNGGSGSLADSRFSSAGTGAKLPVSGLDDARESGELSAAKLAEYLNRHSQLRNYQQGDALINYTPGYEKIAFINGAQSADRYDLSKQLDSVLYDPSMGSVIGRKGGYNVVTKTVQHSSEIADVIGKDLAKRLLDSPKNGYGMHELKGIDLKVGGEGMRYFYDSIVPNAVKAMAKKLGGEVGEVSIGSAWSVVDVSDKTVAGFNSEEEARKWIADTHGVDEDGYNDSYGVIDTSDSAMRQPGLTITPAMREKAADGLPLFARQQGFDIPDETRARRVQRAVQDYFRRVLTVQDAIASQGGTVTEQSNVYLAEESSRDRIANQLKDFADLAVRPLVEKAAKNKVDLDELALYAYARYAPDRNAKIAQINDRFPDGGSGMTNQESADILAAFDKEGKTAILDELHGELMDMVAATRAIQLDDGLISQEQYDAWSSEPNYIPLRGFEQVDDDGKPVRGLSRGRGMDVRGKESMAALGRSSRAGNLIENVLLDHARAVERGDHNKVGRAFLQLVLDNPDSSLWEIDTVRTRQSMDRSTGQVKRSGAIEKGEQTFSVKVGGKEVYVSVYDPLLLRALRNLSANEISGFERVLVKSVGAYTNLLRNTLTRYNPTFAATNAVKDIGFANTYVLGKLGAEGVAKFNANLTGALGAAWRDEAGKIDPNKRAWDKVEAEYHAAGGGSAGGWYGHDAETVAKEMRTLMLLAGATPKTAMEKLQFGALKHPAKAARGLLRGLEMLGATSENMTRLAVYKTARDMGWSVAESASLAKNATTNFTRKGEWGTSINAAYMFFNAGIQGTAALGEALKSPKVQGALAGLTALSVAAAVIGASVGGDDEDDGQNYWDKIPDYEKDRNLIIMLPPGVEMEGAERVGAKGRYIKIPVQYGLNFFTTLGYSVADVLRNQSNAKTGKTAAKAGVRIAASMAATVNPFGGSVDINDPNSIALALAPTVADTAIQLWQGVNAFGGRTVPEKSPYDNKPDSENTTMGQYGGAAHKVTRWLNSATGGNQGKSGAIDIAPGTVENVVTTLTGGTGRFLMDVFVNLPTKLASADATVTSRDVPFWRNFYGEADTATDAKLFYERRKEIMDKVDEINDQIKLGIDPKPTDREKALYALGDAAKESTKLLTELKKYEIAIIDSDASKTEKDVRIKEIKSARSRLFRAYDKAFYENSVP